MRPGSATDIEALEKLFTERTSTTGRPGRISGVTTQWGGLRGDLSGFTEQ